MNTSYPRMVSERTGIVRRVVSEAVPAHFPKSFSFFTAVLSDSARWSRWASDSTGAGYAFGDSQAAVDAAVGEAAERYCGNLVPPGLQVASYEELASPAVDPESLALFSKAQYEAPGFPFEPFGRDLRVEWVAGRELRTGAEVLAPASLVFVSHPLSVGPRVNPVMQAGLAAGATRADAERGALAEVIERDTMTMAWSGRQPLRLIRGPRWLERFAGRMSVRFLSFPNELGALVVGALLRDPELGYLTLGMACRNEPVSALRKALGEAMQLQRFVAAYDDPGGAYMQAASEGGSPLAPWRADRRYADSYRRDLRDVVDYGCHLQLYLDPAMQERFEAELARRIESEVPWTGLSGSLDLEGYRAISVEVTTPDVRVAGLSVVRVVVPGLYSNAAAGLPFLGGRLAGERFGLPLPH